MSSLRCDACNGYKKIRKLGMIYKKCSNCNGEGWLTIEEPEQEVKITKKRKRKITPELIVSDDQAVFAS